VVVIAIVAVVVSLMNGSGKTYFVPTVNGLTLTQAEAQVSQQGLTYTAVPRNSTLPNNTVIDTVPGNGQSIPAHGNVTILYSAGQAKVSVPDLTGKQANDATTQLTRLGLVPNVQQDPNSTAPKGTVDKQDPAPNSQVAPGSSVTIYVSGGGVTVKSVIGEQYLQAQQDLENLGFQVNAQAQAAPSNQPVQPGVVWSQNPAPNSEQPRGTTITIFYEPQASPTPTPSTTSPTATPTDTSTATPTPTGTGTATSTPTTGGNGGGPTH
jgi:serine/threonine-protein kinase